MLSLSSLVDGSLDSMSFLMSACDFSSRNLMNRIELYPMTRSTPPSIMKVAITIKTKMWTSLRPGKQNICDVQLAWSDVSSPRTLLVVLLEGKEFPRLLRRTAKKTKATLG
eukprot:GHVQ01007860.1.p1 GENE.GHVQ01007860.1~~GHVQ01007860.1.p1  ORF type:complete len:111 (-),score=5.22 GHVQ01007860.1:230-562(-)